MNTPVSHLPDWSYNFFRSMGESVRKETLKKTRIANDTRSIWFPHGELRFGGHYSPSKLQTQLEMMSDTELVELGRKSFRLRRNIGAIIAGLLIATGGYHHASQDNHLPTKPTISQSKN